MHDPLRRQQARDRGLPRELRRPKKRAPARATTRNSPIGDQVVPSARPRPTWTSRFAEPRLSQGALAGLVLPTVMTPGDDEAPSIRADPMPRQLALAILAPRGEAFQVPPAAGHSAAHRPLAAVGATPTRPRATTGSSSPHRHGAGYGHRSAQESPQPYAEASSCRLRSAQQLQ